MWHVSPVWQSATTSDRPEHPQPTPAAHLPGNMFSLLLLVLTCVAAQDTSYCSLSPQHTLCRNKGLGPLCGQPGERGLSVREQEEVTDYHNRLRSGVARGVTGQPPAADMRQLQWDPELARVAQRLADQCKFAHDCPDCRRVQRFKVGQNLYQSFSTRTDKGSNWRAAIDSWYDEISQFSATSVARYRFSPQTGHYSQLVWGSTHRLGCGVTQFRKGRFNARLYVCNYGQAGNELGSSVYSQGPPCSSCPSSCSTSYPGLCSTPNQTMDMIQPIRPMKQMTFMKPTTTMKPMKPMSPKKPIMFITAMRPMRPFPTGDLRPGPGSQPAVRPTGMADMASLPLRPTPTQPSLLSLLMQRLHHAMHSLNSSLTFNTLRVRDMFTQ